MDFFRAQFTKIPQIVPINLSTSTVLITGANSGIGFETAREVLRSKPKRLILAVRSLERGNTASSELAKVKSPSTEIDVRQLDQSSFSSVKVFAEGLSGQKVDIAILNAGTWSFKWGQTADGYETDLQINVLGPALLSLLLLQNLRSAASARTPQSSSPQPHLCFVSSGLHTMAKFTERKLPAGEIIAALNDESKYNGADRYATTKLIGLLWAKELANRIEKEEIVVNAPNPGFCKTSLMNDSSGVMKVLVKALSAGVGRSAEDGAKCVVDAAIIKGSDSHGRYLSETKIKDEADMARGDEGKQLQSKLWEEIVNVLKEKKIWTALEQNLGIVVASLPTLRAFFKEFGQSLRSSAGSIFGAWTTRSRISLSEEVTDKGPGTQLENGLVWSDSGSGISGKSQRVKVAEHPLEQDMDLKYLGGNLKLQTTRDAR